jgi:hypothetical protein
MTAAARLTKPAPRLSARQVFIARAEARATLWQCGELDLADALDGLQHAAEDCVQEIIAKAFEAVSEAPR